MASLTEAITTGTEWLKTFNEGDLIDEESGFTADHLAQLIEWASTCADATPPEG